MRTRQNLVDESKTRRLICHQLAVLCLHLICWVPTKSIFESPTIYQLDCTNLQGIFPTPAALSPWGMLLRKYTDR